MKKFSAIIFSLLIFIFHAHAITRDALIDSVVTEANKQILESQSVQTSSGNFERSWITGKIYGSFTITIDLAKWSPVPDTSNFYLTKIGSYEYSPVNVLANHIEDSINFYNHHYRNDPNYVAYYNIVLLNFPFELSKDISSFQATGDESLFNQLQEVQAIVTNNYTTSLQAFYTIIENVAHSYTTLNAGKKVVVYGCAKMQGQYSTANTKCVSFVAQVVRSAGFSSEQWITDIYRLPKLLTPEKEVDLATKTLQVATAVKQYIECNAYGNCHFDATVFGNVQARYLLTSLKDVAGLDKSLLLRVACNLNALSVQTAWCVLTIQHERQTLESFQNPLLSLYSYFGNNDLNYFLDLAYKAKRGENQLKTNPQITRDSAMYYGWILYRNDAFMKSIPVAQKIALMKTIVLSSCADISGGADIAVYDNHCESIMMAIYHNINDGEEKVFMDELKSNGLLWSVTFRLDNSTFGFFGKDNYTDFIFTISNYWRKAYPEKITATKNSGVNFNAFKWEETFFNSNAWITTAPAQNSILATTLYRSNFLFSTASTISMDVYDPVLIDPVGHSEILGLNAGQQLLVPAIFLDWLSNKKMFSDISTVTQVVLATAGLLTGVGDLIEAGSVAMRVVGILETTIAASDLVLLNQSVQNAIIGLFENPQDGRDFIQEYQDITMLINGAIGLKGLLVNFAGEADLFGTRFLQKEAELKNVLGENSAEFKGMKKLDGELGEEVQVINAVANGISFEEFVNTVNDFKNGANPELAQQAYNLFVQEKWVELEQMFMEHGLNIPPGKTMPYPPNFGGYNVIHTTLDPINFNNDLIIERFGDPTGYYASPSGTTFEQRALPYANTGQIPNRYRVLHPIPNVEEGKIIPWFGQEGNGIQYKFDQNINWLIEKGFIEIIQ